MKIEHISISRSKVFEQCHYLYRLKYDDKLEVLGPEQFFYTYGKLVHKIAELYVRSQGDRSIGEISNDVLRGKIEYEEGKKAPILPNDYKNRLSGHLHTIKEVTKKTGFSGELEYKFQYDLDPPNKKYVTGFIDRLIIKDDKAWILDYKTTKKGKWRLNGQSILVDPQLRCYSRVVHKEFGILPENIKAGIIYLEGGDMFFARYSESSLLEIEKNLLNVYNEIQSMPTERAFGKVGEHCNRCDYKTVCPFFNAPSSRWDGDMTSLNLL